MIISACFSCSHWRECHYDLDIDERMCSDYESVITADSEVDDEI